MTVGFLSFPVNCGSEARRRVRERLSAGSVLSDRLVRPDNRRMNGLQGLTEVIWNRIGITTLFQLLTCVNEKRKIRVKPTDQHDRVVSAL